MQSMAYSGALDRMAHGRQRDRYVSGKRIREVRPDHENVHVRVVLGSPGEA